MAGPCPPLVLLLAAPLNSVNSVAGLRGWALSSSCPPLGRAPELLGSVAGPCPPLGRARELCPLCGWALWLWAMWLGPAPLNSVNSVAGPCPPLVLLLAAPLNSVNSVAGLCGWALSSSWPRP